MSSSKLMTYYIQHHNEGFSVISNRQPFNERAEGAQTQTVYIYDSNNETGDRADCQTFLQITLLGFPYTVVHWCFGCRHSYSLGRADVGK